MKGSVPENVLLGSKSLSRSPCATCTRGHAMFPCGNTCYVLGGAGTWWGRQVTVMRTLRQGVTVPLFLQLSREIWAQKYESHNVFTDEDWMTKFVRHWQHRTWASNGILLTHEEDPFLVLRPTDAWCSLTNVFPLVSIDTRHCPVCACVCTRVYASAC